MKQKHSFKNPIFISILLHVIIFSLLFWHFSSPPIHSVKNVRVIQAVALNENQMAPTANHPTVTQTTIRKIEQSALKEHEVASPPSSDFTPASSSDLTPPSSHDEGKRKEVELQAPHQTETKTKKLAAERNAKELKKKQQQAALKRREQEAAEIQKELDSEKTAPKTENQGIEPVEGLESPQEFSDAKASTHTPVGASVHAQAGEVDKYKQMIIDAISRRWLIPDLDNQDLACQLLVHVGPGGIVLNVDIIKESGDETLDRSARNAILKASPLPVPEDTELFDNFRSLRLTFRPQGIVSG